MLLALPRGQSRGIDGGADMGKSADTAFRWEKPTNFRAGPCQGAVANSIRDNFTPELLAMITKTIRILACALGALLVSGEAQARLKPGTYVISITDSCDTFKLTLDPNKYFVYGTHDLTNCSNPGSYVASGYQASINKTVIPPYTGSAWLVTSSNDPNWIFSIDLVHDLIGVVQGTATSETAAGPAAITYTYTRPGALTPLPHSTGKTAFGAH
jgi:hypothetical protein